ERGNYEALDYEGGDPRRQRRGQEPEPGTGNRQVPAPDADVHQEQDRPDDGDHHEQAQGRQLGVDVGVRGPLDLAAGRVQEVVLPQPVAPRPQEGDEADEDRQVRLHLRRDPVGGGLGTDAARQVVGGGNDERDDDQRSERPPVEEPVEGQPEDIETDVAVEDRVDRTEGNAVQGEHEPVPERGGAEAEEQGQGGAAAAGDPGHVGHGG